MSFLLFYYHFVNVNSTLRLQRQENLILLILIHDISTSFGAILNKFWILKPCLYITSVFEARQIVLIWLSIHIVSRFMEHKLQKQAHDSIDFMNIEVWTSWVHVHY